MKRILLAALTAALLLITPASAQMLVGSAGGGNLLLGWNQVGTNSFTLSTDSVYWYDDDADEGTCGEIAVASGTPAAAYINLHTAALTGLKVVIYRCSDGALIASGAITTGSDHQWLEITLTATASVTAGQRYKTGVIINDTSSARVLSDEMSDWNIGIDDTGTYANPPDPSIGTPSLAGLGRMSIYVTN